MRCWLFACCCQVTCAGLCTSCAGPSSLPAALETRPRCKPHHLSPLIKTSRPENTEDSEKKENLTTSGLSLETIIKIKSPMSPRENLAPLPSPKFSKTSNKPPLQSSKTSVQKHESKTLSSVTTNGRVTKVRRVTEKLSSSKQVITGVLSTRDGSLTKINKTLTVERGECSSKSVQILKQGPKRLKISAIKSDHSNITANNSGEEVNFSATLNKKKVQKVSSSTKCDDQLIWSQIEETSKTTWKSSVSQRPSVKIAPRKLLAQAGPSTACSSESGKLVKLNRSSQLRATNLSPIKSTHKGSIVRKKSLDWEKKRGKSSLKNLPINKKTSSICEDQIALENLHSKSKPKVKGELI